MRKTDTELVSYINNPNVLVSLYLDFKIKTTSQPHELSENLAANS